MTSLNAPATLEVELVVADTGNRVVVTKHATGDDAILYAAQACIDAPRHARARIWRFDADERIFVDTIYGNGTGQAYADAWSA